MATGRTIRVRGQVQGVGFRPFVLNLALHLKLEGDVRNDSEGVLIRAAGEHIEAFIKALNDRAPPLARVESVEVSASELPDFIGFSIASSTTSVVDTHMAPDAATCGECLDEIRGSGRRHGYAFTNCTNCGPRFSILNSIPYDRAMTTMADFSMCAACRREYTDVSDRRFHAQPVACPDCGPFLGMQCDRGGDPLQTAAEELRLGRILAIKGLGGFHIACDATNARAVEELRRRKHRPRKPLAVMGTIRMVRKYAEVSSDERDRLSSSQAPILLLRNGESRLPDAIAPSLDRTGWMLPNTPLHHLLLSLVKRPLVMTSGNRSGDPQVIDNKAAAEELSSIVDNILFHNRKIARRLDDSVEQLSDTGPIVLRRGRGLAPEPLTLPPGFGGRGDVLAFGGDLKSAICLTKGRTAILSQHLGDLSNAKALDGFLKADRDFAMLIDHSPVAVACDAHPQYHSTRNAVQRTTPVIKVQHHHAHLAACLIDNRWAREAGPVAGIVLDGLGFGEDGTFWGGEVLLGDYQSVQRIAYLKPAYLPGGDAANEEPWRNLLSRLDQAGLQDLADEWLPDKPLDLLRQAVSSGVNSPLSSSVGRLFDAMAAALNCAPARISFEGEAAMALEALARSAQNSEAIELPVRNGEIDPGRLFLTWAERRHSDPDMAAVFHATVARAFAEQARRLVEAGQASAVALSGGCMQNTYLLNRFALELEGLPVLFHSNVPANDGGLAIGQAAVALAKLEQSPN